MLRSFAHPVACCCLLLGVVAQSWKPVIAFSPVHTDATLCANNSQHFWELLHLFASSLKTDRIKAISSTFSGGKQVLKVANSRNRGRVVYSRKMMVNNERKWSVSFLDAVVTVDVFTAIKDGVKTYRNSNCTFCKSKIVLPFWQNKQTRPRLILLANFFTCLPPEIPRDIASIPSTLKRVRRWRVSWIRAISE